MPIVHKASGADTDLVDAGDIEARQPSAQRLAAHILEVRGFPRGGVVRPKENNHGSVSCLEARAASYVPLCGYAEV